MAVVYMGRREIRGKPLSACDYDSRMAVALGWTGSECRVLVAGSWHNMLVSGFGVGWHTPVMPSHHRKVGALVSPTPDYCFYHSSLRRPDMGPNRSGTTAPEVHSSSGNATASES